MFSGKYRLILILLLVFGLPAGIVYAMGFQLGETKEQLKLEYDVSVQDHGTGRVTIVLKLTNAGRLNPISSIDFVVPPKEPNKEGGNHVDLSVALAISEYDGEQTARIHVLRELAERAEIQLRTNHVDGKQELLTWYYRTIPIAKYIQQEVPVEKQP